MRGDQPAQTVISRSSSGGVIWSARGLPPRLPLLWRWRQRSGDRGRETQSFGLVAQLTVIVALGLGGSAAAVWFSVKALRLGRFLRLSSAVGGPQLREPFREMGRHD